MKEQIHYYVKDNKQLTEKILGRLNFYEPYIGKQLNIINLPVELKLLPAAISDFTNDTISAYGKVGIWQLNEFIAQYYGMRITASIDERYYFQESTRVALDYISNLQEIFKDWGLTISAYICGAGSVANAIGRSDTHKTIWDIYELLPADTREQIPCFFAFLYVYNHADSLGLQPVEVDSLAIFTPELPIDSLTIKNKKHAPPPIPPSPGILDEMAEIYYKIKSGDNLGYISEWFGISIREIKNWNGLRSDMIRSGQTLIIFAPNSQASYYRKINNLTFIEKQALTGKSSSGKLQTNNKKNTTIANSINEWTYYTVKGGDNPYIIAKKFAGVNADDILKWNKIKDTRKIQIGQELRIKK